MYKPEDLHGFMSTINSWTYSPNDTIKRLEKENDELKDKIKDLEKLLSEYTRLHDEDNFTYIDGHYCYREIIDMKIDSIDMKPDYSGLYFNMTCKVVYKDIKTHELIAVRHMEEGIGESEKCTEI